MSKIMPLADCAQELWNRGFVFSHEGRAGDGGWGSRQYWKRADGKPDVFFDHSATITKVGTEWMISDFVNREEDPCPAIPG